MKKKFIVMPQNNGKVLGFKMCKVFMSDEPLNKNGKENIEINLSDYEGFTLNKDSRFEVIVKQIK